jgi:inorganic pyrophosphatase
VKPHQLPSLDAAGVNVIVETPRGSRTKYSYDPKSGLILAKKFLPYGMVFPANFGFVPSTKAGDGDPLDALLFMDEPAFPGTLFKGRVLGAVKASQKEEGRRFRNDRLIVFPLVKGDHADVRTMEELPPGFMDELERFFVTYNEAQGKEFEVLGRIGPGAALDLLRAARRKKSA